MTQLDCDYPRSCSMHTYTRAKLKKKVAGVERWPCRKRKCVSPGLRMTGSGKSYCFELKMIPFLLLLRVLPAAKEKLTS